jgi:hypothetical protein
MMHSKRSTIYFTKPFKERFINQLVARVVGGKMSGTKSELKRLFEDALKTVSERSDFDENGLWMPILRTKIEDDVDYWNDAMYIIDIVSGIVENFGCKVSGSNAVDVDAGSYLITIRMKCRDGEYAIGADVDYDEKEQAWVLTSLGIQKV